MSGWVVQGVRGEGKTLCAVGKIKEYMLRGCPVATNLDLYLDKLLPDDNASLAYRLPDKPRAQDFEALPPAYDRDYKGEDKNGLIVLDELALWLNSRSFKEKGRQGIIEWLLLSRKDHWDLMLLCQDHEMIDKQLKTTVCDYLVQASRTDRQRIPYLSSFLDFFFLSNLVPNVHIYGVYYGFSFLDKAQQTWRFTGTDLYDGYDTNQRFTDGYEVIELKNDDGSRRVITQDMRAVYSYLPACYLSGYIHIQKFQKQIDFFNSEKEDKVMARSKNIQHSGAKVKIILLSLFLVGFLSWRIFFTESSASVLSAKQKELPALLPAVENSVPLAVVPEQVFKPKSVGKGIKPKLVAVKKMSFLDTLVTSYRPRLMAHLRSAEKGDYFIIGFYEGNNLVERFTVEELHALRVGVVAKSYGADLITDQGVYPVTSWKLKQGKG